VQARPKAPQKVPQKPVQPKRREDFDSELMGKKITLQLWSGEWVTGVVTDCSRFWLKLLVGSKTVLVNKSGILRIEQG